MTHRLLWILTLLLATRPVGAQEPATAGAGADPEARALIEAFLSANARVKGMTYRLEKIERMRDGKVAREQLSVKLRPRPYAVYLARLKPGKGMEAIYRADRADKEMTAHTGEFPDVTLDLNPEGGLAMKDQHHPIHGTGLHEDVRRLKQADKLLERSPDKIHIRKIPDQQVGGRAVPCIEIDASKLKGWRVEAREDETLHALARRVDSWPYLLYRYNPKVDDLDDELDAGQSIFVPSYYAKRTEFCFDPDNHLIVRERYLDAKGVYEQYDILDRKVNPGLTARDFDPDNKAYDF